MTGPGTTIAAPFGFCANSAMSRSISAGSNDDPEKALDRTDRTAQLGRAVDNLPPGQRDAVKHLMLLEQSLDEAAASTRKTAGAIKVNLHRALKALRARMGGKD